MRKPKFLIPLMIATSLFLGGCNATKTIDGKTYGVYGVFNENEMKNPKIRYQISVVSLVMAIILCETIIVPFYVIGWDLWEPVGPNLLMTMRKESSNNDSTSKHYS